VVSELIRARSFRLSLAAAGAAVLCTVLATRVFVDFDGLRAKLVKTSVRAIEGLVRVDTSFDRRVASLDAPVAVIASISNTAAAPARFLLHADGLPICETVVPPYDTRRLDCTVVRDWERRGSHVIEIHGPSADWTLDYLEVATHHGSSTRALYLVVLPDVATNYIHPGPLLVILFFIAIAAMWLVPVSVRWSPAALKVHRGVCVVAVLFLAVVVISPWASPFLVLISIGSFTKLVAILLAPQVSQLAKRLWQAGQQGLRRSERWRPQIAATATAAVVLLTYGVFIRQAAQGLEGQYSGLLRVSEATFDRVPFLQGRADVRQSLKLDKWGGYDAQFQYFAIYDPLLRRSHEVLARMNARQYRWGEYKPGIHFLLACPNVFAT
jgi:hypothetical protein